MMSDNQHTFTNGTIGMLSSSIAVVSSFQTQLEWWVRISGSALFCLVSLFTLINLIRGLLKNQ